MLESVPGVAIGRVNAAFLREIKDDHRELHLLIRRCARLLAAPHKGLTSPELVRELVPALRDQLALHFSLEESFGYCDMAFDNSPELDSRAQRLRGEHAELYQDIAQLAEQVERDCRAEVEVEQLHAAVERLAAFMRRLKRHESAENILIFEASDRDLGVGD